ncbi:hypothetical protein CsatA_025111 [Cannabis sativa]
MELPSPSSSTYRTSSSKSGRCEKFINRVIWPAIRGKSCPICLESLHIQTSAVLTLCTHAFCEVCIRRWSYLKRKCPLCIADFDSWFSRIDLSSQNFRKHRLPALNTTSSTQFRLQEQHSNFRTVISSLRRRSSPLPWRRSFGRPGLVGSDVIAQRKLRWRSSIYEKQLKAVPITPMENVEQNMSLKNGVKERILGRIEPWIRRELQAVLGDPDPSVIVHVVSSLYIATLEKKIQFSSTQLDLGDNFLDELRPFLLDKTDMFWHEVRCFAESSFTIETYDAVIEYTE